MTAPEAALQQARTAAASMRASGAYGEERDQVPFQVRPSAAITTGKLFEWALIEPDLRDVRSTRRLGAPITALKRGLLRLLAQYHGELIAEQTRFNVYLVGYVRRLEERIDELEGGSPSERPDGAVERAGGAVERADAGSGHPEPPRP
ncbi:MAG: hypothetical protein ACR2IP_11795 [Solirubrobacteraceae bacterium]